MTKMVQTKNPYRDREVTDESGEKQWFFTITMITLGIIQKQKHIIIFNREIIMIKKTLEVNTFVSNNTLSIFLYTIKPPCPVCFARS